MTTYAIERAGWWLAWLAGIAVLLAAAAAAGAAEDARTVFYQVTYTNGRTADLPAVPKTNRGIARVLRVVRAEQGDRGYEILSTGPQPLTLVSRGQTYRTDMRWNGSAWVAPEDKPAPAEASGRPRPAPDANLPDMLATRGRLLKLASNLLETEAKLAAAAKALDANTPPAAALAEARRELCSAVRDILTTTRGLPGGAAAAPPAEATGKVTPADAAPARPAAAGIVRPTDRVAALGHRVQVWPVPPGQGARRHVRVSMAHPEAGLTGAFYYVAYADTTGDGRPDTLVARSPLARADRAGQWTQWRFAAAHSRLWAGKAWLRPDAAHYHVEGVRIDDNWRGPPPRVYVAAHPWAVPTRRWGPCAGNLRVWVEP